MLVLYEWKGGGESLDKLYDRCTSALQRIGDKHKGFISFFLTNHISGQWSAHIVLLSIALIFVTCGDDEGERVVVVTHGGAVRS